MKNRLPEEIDPKNFLEIYKNQPVDFFRFPGNYGDSLIWHGTKVLLNSLNISEHYVEISSPKYNDVLFIDGGGNFVDYYSDVRNFLIKKPSLYGEIIILPHTIFGEKQIEILNNISSKLTVFCREKVSAEFVASNLTHGNVYLWHDCAFYNKFPAIPSGEGALNAFRSDKESVLGTLPESNDDISYNGYAQKPLDKLVSTLGRYAQINTDRLHVAICATLLGKRVKLFPNSYYKNKAVFDYSLKRFPNINFVDNTDKIELAKGFARKKFEAAKTGNHYIEVFQIIQDEFSINDTNLLMAGILHDTLEDTNTTYEELAKAFSKDVADLVEEVSHPKNYNHEQRTQFYEKLKSVTPRAKMIKLADFTSHLRKFIEIYKVLNFYA